MSRGLDNCNPGNIRISPTHFRGEVQPSRDKSFKQFISMAYGYRAMFKLLDTYAKRYNLNTIRTMIARYAPSSENFTEGYIRFVAAASGIDADRRIDTRSERDMVAIVAAMSKIENGESANLADVNEGWRLFVEG